MEETKVMDNMIEFEGKNIIDEPDLVGLTKSTRTTDKLVGVGLGIAVGVAIGAMSYKYVLIPAKAKIQSFREERKQKNMVVNDVPDIIDGEITEEESKNSKRKQK